MAASILIVDDDPVQRRLVDAALRKAGHDTLVADHGQAAMDALEDRGSGAFGAMVLDLAMPGLDGIGVLKQMRARGIAVPVVVQTAQGSIDAVVQAMRHGAFDFVVKPASPERLQTAVAAALKLGALEGEVVRAPRRGSTAHGFKDIITKSPAMERVLRLARKAASSVIPILVEGESGVGKELIARAIQGSGERRSKPFVTVNCGAIPDNLVESILFGHEKGSFTGASERHTGKFVEANGGTLFLDEVGELPLSAQVKLLRAVQTGEIDPVGGRATVTVDIRLISATNRDLIQRVRDGAFREDLFYRLNVFPIYVPPLRERREDIPQLVRHFMERLAPAKGGARPIAITPDALALLRAYDWPGNIRQLENAVLRASVLSDGDVLTIDEFPQIRAEVEGTINLDRGGDVVLSAQPESGLHELGLRGRGQSDRRQSDAGGARAVSADFTEPQANRSAPAAPQPHLGMLRALDGQGEVRALADVELEMIRLAIEHYDGQMSEIARRLGIGRSTLYRKLKEYGIDPESRHPAGALPS